MGLGSITDMFSALEQHVFEKAAITLETFLKVLTDNFEGHDELRAALLYETPKYGNDDERADRHATWVFEAFYDAVNGKRSPRGATYRINMLPTTSHVYFGKVVGATPDGRLAGEPLSEGISPFQGMDRKGPTAVLNSALKIDHLKTGGTLLNQSRQRSSEASQIVEKAWISCKGSSCLAISSKIVLSSTELTISVTIYPPRSGSITFLTISPFVA